MRNYVPGTTLIINYDYWVILFPLVHRKIAETGMPYKTLTSSQIRGIDDSERYQNVIMVVVQTGLRLILGKIVYLVECQSYALDHAPVLCMKNGEVESIF
ncbi:hypothetical protein HCBG_07353 [Histoplasma capsulatum G186AR]|uniref:Uncharacterized protein n=1 Tax=Ajellomyces capsulatus (strain G186AR / H82 / ATCC MYA-2454 / RMSCC 2432) TaxID=447093 RepID=C0NW23_AJECG|nr:uncharacterized protein HCBG_07353 [Histoplasma capsulatum G186AR]EEH04128.1 hypothetical protein HCBG_07353 [Histoplasma capsulatum G186AR]